MQGDPTNRQGDAPLSCADAGTHFAASIPRAQVLTVTALQGFAVWVLFASFYYLAERTNPAMRYFREARELRCNDQELHIRETRERYS